MEERESEIFEQHKCVARVHETWDKLNINYINALYQPAPA